MKAIFMISQYTLEKVAMSGDLKEMLRKNLRLNSTFSDHGLRIPVNL